MKRLEFWWIFRRSCWVQLWKAKSETEIAPRQFFHFQFIILLYVKRCAGHTSAFSWGVNYIYTHWHLATTQPMTTVKGAVSVLSMLFSLGKFSLWRLNLFKYKLDLGPFGNHFRNDVSRYHHGSIPRSEQFYWRYISNIILFFFIFSEIVWFPRDVSARHG